jgi:regulator of ribonuclease activity A
MKTADLCDAHPGLRVLAPLFRDYGSVCEIAGAVVTLKVFEDNQLVRSVLETAGKGRVLVVDGGGSLRTALVGGNLGKLAETNGWAGVLVHGAVRDAAELATCRVGIKALATVPKKSAKTGAGEREVEVTFAGLTIRPTDWLFADEDGIVIADHALGSSIAGTSMP